MSSINKLFNLADFEQSVTLESWGNLHHDSWRVGMIFALNWYNLLLLWRKFLKTNLSSVELFVVFFAKVSEKNLWNFLLFWLFWIWNKCNCDFTLWGWLFWCVAVVEAECRPLMPQMGGEFENVTLVECKNFDIKNKIQNDSQLHNIGGLSNHSCSRTVYLFYLFKGL